MSLAHMTSRHPVTSGILQPFVLIPDMDIWVHTLDVSLALKLVCYQTLRDHSALGDWEVYPVNESSVNTGAVEREKRAWSQVTKDDVPSVLLKVWSWVGDAIGGASYKVSTYFQDTA